MEKCPLKRSSGDMATKQHTEENCKSPFQANLPSSGHICQPGGQRGCWRPCSQKTPSGGGWENIILEAEVWRPLIQCIKRASTSVRETGTTHGQSEEQVFTKICPDSWWTGSGLWGWCFSMADLTPGNTATRWKRVGRTGNCFPSHPRWFPWPYSTQMCNCEFPYE